MLLPEALNIVNRIRPRAIRQSQPAPNRLLNFFLILARFHCPQSLTPQDRDERRRELE